MFRLPGTTLYNGTRWPWVNGGEKIDVLYKDWLTLDALNEKFYIDSPTGSLGFDPGSTRTRTSYAFRPRRRYGRILHGWRRPDVLSPSRQHRPDLGKLEPSRQQDPTDPKYLNRVFSYSDRSNKRADRPVSETDRTAQMGYEYNAYKLPPQPRRLSTEEAAERERTYKTLHERALGGWHHAPASVDGF